MAVANALLRGRLRQFSAQYGGWLSIEVALFGRALVMDPDADAPSAMVTPRRRRNSSAAKAQWMELLAVESIRDVRKEDKPWSVEDDAGSAALSPPAAARRSRRSSAAEFVSMGFGFTVVTTTQTFQFEAATEAEREDWVRSLLLAKKLLNAESAAQDAFFRFAASDSDDSSDSDDDGGGGDERASGEENRGGAANSSRGESSVRSAQPLSSAQHSPTLKPRKTKGVALTILHVTATDAATGDSIEVTVPLTEASQDQVSVKQVKLDVIQQLRTRLGAAPTTTPGVFRDLLRREADFFLLCDDERELWFQDEHQPMAFYLRRPLSPTGAAAATEAKRALFLALRPINTLPPPMLEVAIPAAKNKVSDLSQTTYTAYQLDVSFNAMKWQVTRRYKEFDALQSRLKDKYAPVPLPKLPPKHLFTPREGEFVDRRREQLENYVQQLVLHPLAGSDVLVLSFLGVVSTARDPELGNREQKNVLHITTLHQSLDCGDILLFSCRFGASVLQRKFTGAKYDHVGIVVPGMSRNLLRIMEATSEGIQVYSLKARLLAYSREVSNVIAVRKIRAERTPELVARLRAFVAQVEGNPYSILGILRSQSDSTRRVLDAPSKALGNGARSPVASGASSDAAVSSGGSQPDPDAATPTGTAATVSPKAKKRKYFCSSLAASTLKHLGWIDTSRSSSHFWPGSFEDGGEVEQYVVAGVAAMEPEAVIDCRIVEVGLATQDAKPRA
ncbi:hypothetical protein PybrP1_006183 [[Pythium] brassicae (nom. inval.)]|nr:hypothetical protein PybrP1_006183 [[Pythium] brassicae (nom. inval.)]